MRVTRAILGAVLGKGLPILEGEIRVEGLLQSALIRRDAYGIPFIRAESEADAFFALGFCQGQDRAFQIERLTRTTRGTLSEIFGSISLPIDRLTARVGLFDRAADQLPLLDDHDQALMKAFVSGVNAGVEGGCRSAAPEFRLLGIQPSRMGNADPLGILNFVAFVLSPWAYKINRLMILREVGPEALQIVDGAYPEWIGSVIPVAEPTGSSDKKSSADLKYLAGVLGFGQAGGSNSWVVNASRSASGRPLLANDPHLSPNIPSHWYLACLETPEYTLRGAALAGTPFFSIGHNSQAAWGVTGGSADNTDLFLEELDNEGLQVREKNGFQPLKIIHHKILVKGKDPFEDRILITPRGPIISDVLDDVDLTLSIQTSWMRPKPIRGLFKVYQAQSFQDFREGWIKWYQAAMNMLYADQKDQIGWQFIGDFPARKRAAPIPLPGWDPKFTWGEEPIPFENMPWGENPALGLIATANTKPIPGEEPYLGFDFADGYRQVRIVEVLKERRTWDLEGMAALQEDQLALPWREIRDIVLGTPIAEVELREALAALAVWDGRVSAESPAASLYEYTLAELVRELAETLAPDVRDWFLGKSVHPILYASLGKRQVSHLSRILQGDQQVFRGPKAEVVKRALSQALKKLKEEFGEHPDDWAWGKIRPLVLEHPFGSQPIIGRIFQRGPFPWGGDSQTVSQAQRSLRDPTHNPTGIANLRMVLDVGQWENNTFVLAGGQSGNPFSRHYDDQLPLWRKGEGIQLAWGESNIKEKTVERLALVPREGRGTEDRGPILRLLMKKRPAPLRTGGQETGRLSDRETRRERHTLLSSPSRPRRGRDPH